MINDKAYWTKFYSELNAPLSPSPFAQFLIEEDYFKNAKSLVELGCGNGRDSRFFAAKNLNVIAIDQCENTTEALNQIDRIKSYAADFTNLPRVENPIDIVYSRFTMHSISEEGENRTIQWAFDSLSKNGMLCIEARTIKDHLCGKGIDKSNNVWYYNNHHRRFIEAEEFKVKLKKLGFDILYWEEKNGFAPFKDKDPVLLRSILIKP